MSTIPDAQLAAMAAERATCRFIHIPGPNPILVPGEPGSWDDGVIEACDILKDHDTYYLYYHGTSKRSGYQIGVATAPHPLGPWTKRGDGPVLAVGEEGSWEDGSVACASVLKQGTNRYTMWYSAMPRREGARWGVGLATAQSPLGPWTRHHANPLLEDFGYVGGVVRMDGLWRLYTEHPIGSTGRDYGPMSLATAEKPEGPWTPHPEPVLREGEIGEWDDGGFSEAEVTYRGGVYHMFYGGAKLHPTRILSRESIGYACSFDGVHFTKHVGNPVAPREANPDAAAFAEVHHLFEPPFIYLYHTLRYNSRDGDEDLGVQVLATQRPFCLAMPLMQVADLPPGEATSLDRCPPLCLASVEECRLTATCACPPGTQGRVRLKVFGSCDGLSYDTRGMFVVDVPCYRAEGVQESHRLPELPMFAKVVVENHDEQETVANVLVTATVRG